MFNQYQHTLAVMAETTTGYLIHSRRHLYTCLLHVLIVYLGSEKKLKKDKKTVKPDKITKSKPAESTSSSESTVRSFGDLKSTLRNATTAELAKKLIGVNLCRRVDGQKVIGKIIETEAYLGYWFEHQPSAIEVYNFNK